MKTRSLDSDKSYDLIVMGSGSAGLSAALAAAAQGLSVCILEKTAKIGGTSAYSGAGTWIPANHHAKAAGIADSVEDAIAYLHAAAPEGWAEEEGDLWEAFARNAPEALNFIEQSTPLSFELLDIPDTYPELPGGKLRGRMVTPRLLRRSIVGRWARKIRTSIYPQIFKYSEMYDPGPLYGGWRVWLSQFPRWALRLIVGKRGLGTGLIIGLLKGCLDRGCDIVLNTRVTQLVSDEAGRVVGVVTASSDRTETWRSRRGVIIASGGFEWDRARVQKHFPGPVDFCASPRANEGDGHRVAEALGAKLDRMDQANLNAAIPAVYEGKVQGIGWFINTAPNAVIIGSDGRRFVNEEDRNLGEALDSRDEDGHPKFLPAWLVSDSRLFARERLAIWLARCDPNWLVTAHNLAELASRLNVDAVSLEATVERYNSDVLDGRDDELGRQWRQAISKPPFLAVPFNRSFMSTKGGPRTNAHAQVLRTDGSVIDGLYCAGVAMANPIGTKAISAGTTIGPNLTWGYIAGMHAARGGSV